MHCARCPRSIKEEFNQYEAVDPFKASVTFSFANLFGTAGTEQQSAGAGGVCGYNTGYDSDSDMNSLPTIAKWQREEKASARPHANVQSQYWPNDSSFTSTPPPLGSDTMSTVYGTGTAIHGHTPHPAPTYRPALVAASPMTTSDDTDSAGLLHSNHHVGGTLNTSTQLYPSPNHLFGLDTPKTHRALPHAADPWVSRHRYSRSKSKSGSVFRASSTPSRSRRCSPSRLASRFGGGERVSRSTAKKELNHNNSQRGSLHRYEARTRRSSRSRHRIAPRRINQHSLSSRLPLHQLGLIELEQNNSNSEHDAAHILIPPRTMALFSGRAIKMPEPVIPNIIPTAKSSKKECRGLPLRLQQCPCPLAFGGDGISMPEPYIPNIIPGRRRCTQSNPSLAYPAYPEPCIPSAIPNARQAAPHVPQIVPSLHHRASGPRFPEPYIPNIVPHSSPHTSHSMGSDHSWGSVKSPQKQHHPVNQHLTDDTTASYPSLPLRNIQRDIPSGAPATSRYSGLHAQWLEPTISNQPWSYVLAFVIDTLPRQIYLHLLLRLPSLYFTRVSRIFEEAEMSIRDIKQGILETAQKQKDALPLLAPDWASFELPVSEPYQNLNRSWTSFIDSLLEEWKTLNFISVLLLMAILTILQLEGAGTDPLTRFTALISMVCALMSLLFGCMYIIRFGTMRKTYKAAEWASEAKRTRTGIFWNVWVMLAMPAAWLAWSMISYLVCVMSFVWRTGSLVDSNRQPFSDEVALVPRIVVTVILSLGLVYFCMIAMTLRRYGTRMDRAWHRRIQDWISELENYTHPQHHNVSRSHCDMPIKCRASADEGPVPYPDEKLAALKSNKNTYPIHRSPHASPPSTPAFNMQIPEKASKEFTHTNPEGRNSLGRQRFPPPGIVDVTTIQPPQVSPGANIGYESRTSLPQSIHNLALEIEGPHSVLDASVLGSRHPDTHTSISTSSIDTRSKSKSRRSPKRGRRHSRLSNRVRPRTVGSTPKTRPRIRVVKLVDFSADNRVTPVHISPPRVSS